MIFLTVDFWFETYRVRGTCTYFLMLVRSADCWFPHTWWSFQSQLLCWFPHIRKYRKPYCWIKTPFLVTATIPGVKVSTIVFWNRLDLYVCSKHICKSNRKCCHALDVFLYFNVRNVQNIPNLVLKLSNFLLQEGPEHLLSVTPAVSRVRRADEHQK